MQSRKRLPSKTRRSKGDLLDQKWLTYLLVLILIALIGVFVVSLRYQEAVVRYAKELVQRAKDALSASLGLKGMLGEFESQSAAKPFAFEPVSLSRIMCGISPINSFLQFLTTLESKSMVFE